jgi:SAM-dependent methyltransferase
VNDLPVPPPKLRVKVAGHADFKAFLQQGERHNRVIREALGRAGVDITQLSRILDWGCGCGRLTRWWQDLINTEVHGCDYNGELVQWVDENLPFVNARVNQLSPPLPYEAESFELISGISLFTHLTNQLALEWMRELRRVLVPGGLVFFTTHGLSFRGSLSPTEVEQFEGGLPVVQFSSVEGSNLCAAFHPPRWVESSLLAGLDLIERREPHTLDADERAALGQDRWLARKPA